MKKSLSYYHIMHGGVPLTEAGVKRFIGASLIGGYTKEQIILYLKDLKVLKEE
jgi:hypothetical protein